MSEADMNQAQHEYQATLQRRREYEQAVEARFRSPEFLATSQKLADTVRDLERRGLLQYDGHAGRYDLHPVVRGIAAGGLRPEERDGYGQRLVDHFSAQAHRPYHEAETLDDVRDGLHVIRTLLKMGRYQQACDAYCGDLANAFFANLQAYAEVLSLLRPFFPQGWATLPKSVDDSHGSYLANSAAITLEKVGELEESLAACSASLAGFLRAADWPEVGTIMLNIAVTLCAQNRLAQEDRCLLSNLNLATLSDNEETIFHARQGRFQQLARIGQWAEAKATWDLLDPMGRNWPRAIYRPGDAEYYYVRFRFWRCDLSEKHLAHAERLAKVGKNRLAVRVLHRLCGEWRLEQGQWALAAESLREAVTSRTPSRTRRWWTWPNRRTRKGIGPAGKRSRGRLSRKA